MKCRINCWTRTTFYYASYKAHLSPIWALEKRTRNSRVPVKMRCCEVAQCSQLASFCMALHHKTGRTAVYIFSLAPFIRRFNSILRHILNWQTGAYPGNCVNSFWSYWDLTWGARQKLKQRHLSELGVSLIWFKPFNGGVIKSHVLWISRLKFGSHFVTGIRHLPYEETLQQMCLLSLQRHDFGLAW